LKFGFVLPRGDARAAANLARDAEVAGWDGFFVWEPVWGFDAWVSLAAAAMATEKIRLGTMLSPISRMRPWTLAGQSVNLDHLSRGRLIISVGLGSIDNGFKAFGEETDRRKRAELLDEGLDILTGLWRGQPFTYNGRHYKIGETKFYPPPPPVQKPRIPIWVVGAWPHERSMRRALRYDGLIPTVIDRKDGARQANLDEMIKIQPYVDKHHLDKSSYDLIVEGKTPGDNPAKAAGIVREWADVGATWWMETLWGVMDLPDWLERTRKRISQGPPRT
jgi:alkanesulfonate monooxygenase SsuD/methylene tetrahydromethanopterin reductase-like flavin-dependent oxidoreductase (luciferase family)